MRRQDVGQLYGGGENDALAERGHLGTRIRQLVESGQVRLFLNVSIHQLAQTAEGIHLASPPSVPRAGILAPRLRVKRYQSSPVPHEHVLAIRSCLLYAGCAHGIPLVDS